MEVRGQLSTAPFKYIYDMVVHLFLSQLDSDLATVQISDNGNHGLFRFFVRKIKKDFKKEGMKILRVLMMIHKTSIFLNF